jgi:hypothetical protein
VLRDGVNGALQSELARHQWEEGRRALERLRADPELASALARQVELVSAELSRRLGQVFSLGQLVEAYADADRWSSAVLHEALLGEVPAYISLVADAAFDLYARRAADYAP